MNEEDLVKIEEFLADFNVPVEPLQIDEAVHITNHEKFVFSHYDFIVANKNTYNKHALKPYVTRLENYIKTYNQTKS